MRWNWNWDGRDWGFDSEVKVRFEQWSNGLREDRRQKIEDRRSRKEKQKGKKKGHKFTITVTVSTRL